MKRLVKRTIVLVAGLAGIGFLAFLYLIPPFFIAPPSTFSDPMKTAGPTLDDIADPAEKAMARRGQYLVRAIGCIGCHGTPTSQGPDLATYMAGGMRITNAHGTFVSRNLTPDKETGLGRRTDEQVLRVLRSGVFPDGHFVPHASMPWADFSHLTEEDRHAILVFLRHLQPVHHVTPEPGAPIAAPPGALETVWAGQDYAHK